MNGDATNGFPFWPCLLVVLAFDFYLATEIHTVWRVTGRFQQQDAAVLKRVEQTQTQMAASRTWQTMLEGMANDLLDLSKTDAEIRKIVDKYQIRKNQPVAAPDAKDDKAAKPAE